MYKISILWLLTCFFTPLGAIQTIRISDTIPSGQDITPLVRNILATHPKEIRIVFPKGTYHFYPDEAMGKYHAITNHDNIYRYFAFPLIGMSNVEIDGGGSDFIFHGLITPFLVEKSEKITLRNFSIDWEQPFFFQAEVTGSHPADRSMDLKAFPFCTPLFEGNRLGFVTNGLHLPFLGESMVFDPRTRAVAYKGQNYVLNTVSSRATFDTRLGENQFRMQWAGGPEPPPSGLLYISKGPNGTNRYCPGIHLSDSKNINLQKIIIYHAGGMGVIGEKTENIHLDGLQVVLREGTDRLLTTTADATHFCNCKGQLLIENCLFENMLDDASNIHGSYLRLYRLQDKHTLQARIGHFQQFGYHFAQAGDSICFVRKSTLLPVGYGVVEQIDRINEQLYQIRFRQPLPESLQPDDGLDNISWYPETVFRNNIVRNNRARGLLISSRNKTRIVHNSFSSMMSAILFEGDMNFWHESGAVRQVEITDNLFLENVYGGRKAAVIRIHPRMAEVDPGQPFEHNIRIERNEFRTFDNAILSALSVDGLVFRNNKIVETDTYPKLFPESPVLEIRQCKQTTIEGNTYRGTRPAQIRIDTLSRPTLRIEPHQSGFRQ